IVMVFPPAGRVMRTSLGDDAPRINKEAGISMWTHFSPSVPTHADPEWLRPARQPGAAAGHLAASSPSWGNPTTGVRLRLAVDEVAHGHKSARAVDHRARKEWTGQEHDGLPPAEDQLSTQRLCAPAPRVVKKSDVRC